MYRPAFLGTNLKAVTHEAMRGPSAWSVGDCELMAAVVSKANECEYCVKAHTAVATRAYQDEGRSRRSSRTSKRRPSSRRSGRPCACFES